MENFDYDYCLLCGQEHYPFCAYVCGDGCGSCVNSDDVAWQELWLKSDAGLGWLFAVSRQA